MRHLILFVCAGVTLSGQAVRPPSGLDLPMDTTVRIEDSTGGNPCHLWIALEQLARQARVRIGFEQTFDCSPAPWVMRPNGNSLNVRGLTPRQAFDRVLSQRPDYRWTEIDGVVVIRPVTAWAPGGSVLNAPVSAFTIADEHPHHSLHMVFQSSQPPLFQEHTDRKLSSSTRRLDDPHATTLIDAPVSVRFAGGSVVQALNAITRGFGGIWQTAYTRHYDNRHSIWVVLYTLEADGGVTHLSSTMFTIATGTPR